MDTRNIHESYDDLVQLWVEEIESDPFDFEDYRDQRKEARLPE